MRIFSFLRPDRLHSEISEELRFHMEMKAAELMRSGMPEEQAWLTARKSFGSPLRIAEAGHDIRSWTALEQIAGDIRFAIRLMSKRKAATAVLVLTVALGIGFNTAVFSVVRSLLLQPLPFKDSDRLLVIHQAKHAERSGVSYPHFQDWRQGNHSFLDMAVYSAGSATLTGQGEPTILSGATASSSLFRVLAVEPIRGRLFREEEDRLPAGANTVNPVLISDRLWRTRFGQREDIFGQRVQLDGHTFQIIGIIPGRLAFPIQQDPVDFWTTVAVDSDPALYGGSIPTSRGYPRYDGAIARLKPHVSIAQARADMNILAANIVREHPKATSANDVVLVSALEEVVGPASQTMVLFLYAAAFCVLLVACTNVANILLADAMARRREFSLRSALGAPVSKLMRQVLTESLLLAFAGGAASLFVAWLVLNVFVVLAPPDTPRLNEIQLGASAIFYVLVISVASGLLFGCLPAIATRRPSLVNALKEGSWSVTRKSFGLRSGPLLITGQIAVSMLFTCLALLLVGSVDRTLHSPRGFNPHQVLSASISLPPASYGQASKRVLAFYDSLLARIRATPGVTAASIAEVLPLSGRSNSTTFEVTGISERGFRSADLRFVDSQYFATLQIPLTAGRTFARTDVTGRPPVAIVNQAFVRKYLGGRDPLSSELRLGWGGKGPKQIVGVVADVRPSVTSPASQPEVYVPFTQFPINDMAVLIRTGGEPLHLADSLRAITRSLDDSVPVDRVRSLDEYLLLSSAAQRFLMWLLAVFAGTTILLSAVGLYGVLSDGTAARTQEFGVRIALGASRRRVVRMVLNQALGIATFGVVVGAALSIGASRLLTEWLFDSGTISPEVFALSGGVLMAVVLFACFLPAKRAASVDPSLSLRAG